ncbi:MAG: GDP-mannose 4,6-dehydratase [Planctomycetia bacterium]|nr:GDP-mannose 4,6-dehydratase [Planctomycetia bacterium]
MASKKAFITGITGQDGAYLARLLLRKGYEVHGLVRRSSSPNTGRIDGMLANRHWPDVRYCAHFGDMTDTMSLVRILDAVGPDEVYNLAAQSHVRVSFDMPEFTGDVNGLGTLRLLEAIRSLGLDKTTRFYQASTSELYGKVRETPQTETTPFCPRSPYAIAKLYAYWTCVNYREAYHMFAANGILFNHESPLRGDQFVTKKIVRGAVRIHNGSEEPIRLGNLDARRDWGHAADYVAGMHAILQHDTPDDFVLATGQCHTVRQWLEEVFRLLDRELVWQGQGLAEQGCDRKTGRILVTIDPAFFRPTEVELLCGSADKARSLLHWQPEYTFQSLIADMLDHELKEQ